MSYNKVYSTWKFDQVQFWDTKASEIQWFKRWDKTLKKNDPFSYDWFSGGKLNTCFNCIDRHVNNGIGDKIALIYDSPVTGQKKNYTGIDPKQREGKLKESDLVQLLILV